MSKKAKVIILASLLAVLVFVGVDTVLALETSDVGMEYGNATGLSDTDPRIVAANIIRVILGFLGILALGLIIYAGFLWMTSNGDESKVEKAKNIIKAAVIGLIIILASFGIATFLINSILSSTGSGSGGGDGGDTDPPGPSPTSTPVTYCDAAGTPGVCTTPDNSMCDTDEYCDSSDCTCQPQGGPGDECSASSTACVPEDIQCISDICEDDCTCADTPIINSVSPVGGFCQNNINTPCQSDSDCPSGDSCDQSTPNGTPGNLFTISGHYFGTNPGEVFFQGGGGSIAVQEFAHDANEECEGDWTPTQIVAVVPSGISATSTIVVERAEDGVRDTTDNSIGPVLPDFVRNSIERPGLCQLSPNSGQLHEEITYYGIRLGGSEAHFGNYGQSVPAYTSNFPTELEGVVEVPSIETGSTTTYVEESEVRSNYLEFFKLEEPYTGPYISSFSPNSGPAGDYVTIRGDGFGESRGSNRVFFGDLSSGYEANYDFPEVCSDSVWTDSQVIVKVPSSAPDGDYVITMELGSWVIDTSELSPGSFSIDNTLDPTPNLCKIEPVIGPQNSEISLWGEDFGEEGTGLVRFYRDQDQTNFNYWGTSDSGDAQRIDTNVHEEAITGPVRVVQATSSNGMEFQVGVCTEAPNPDQACGTEQICCPQGTMEEGRCRDSMEDCYLSISSSVYEWEFDSGFGTTSDDDSDFSSCEERSQALNVCSSTLMCPNSPGQCSFNPGGDTSTVIEDGCTAAYCNSGVGDCGTMGNDCEYNNTLNRCAYITGGGSLIECDLPREETLTLEGESDTYDAECVEYNGVGHWQIETSQSCPEDWVSVGDNKCMDSISDTTDTCDSCSEGTCVDDEDGNDIGVCTAEEIVCPDGAECDGDDCVKVESEVCECCCRVGDDSDGDPYAQQDCCSFLDPVSGDVESLNCSGACGSDTDPTDDEGYGYCSGCRIDEDGDGNIDSEEQRLSDQACVCDNSSGQYCDVEADPDNDGDPEGVCRDCTTLSTPEACSRHSSSCCVDAQGDNACRGGIGDSSMVAGDLAYCQYYQCDLDNEVCDIPNPVPSSTQETYTSTTTCEEECSEGTPSGLGMSCNYLTSTTTCYTSICSDPFQCLQDDGNSASYPDCGYCCCDPDSETDCDSLGSGLNCQADKSPCSGSERGLCCGCSEDSDCSNGDPVDTGCGSDTCCRERPDVVSTEPADEEEQVCSNALISAEFDSQMDMGSFSGNVIVVGEYSQACPEGTTYLASNNKDLQNNKNILARLWSKIKRKVYRTWYKLAGLFTDRVYASPPPSPDMNYCAVSGSVEGQYLANGNTEITFAPSQLLDTSRKYFVIIRGDEDLNSETGVLSYWDIGMNTFDSQVDNSSSFSGIEYPNSYIWSFTTLSDQGNNGVCAVDHVDINPSSYLFRTVDNDLEENDLDPNNSTFDTVSTKGYDRDKVFRAVAKSGGDDSQKLAPITGVYSWDWNWTIDNTQIVDTSAPDLAGTPYSDTSNKQLIAAQPDITNGNTSVRAEVNIIDDEGGYGGDGTEGVSDVWVFLCNNPWPPFESNGTWSPWRDNIQGSTNCVEGICPPMNYELYYCRDSGQKDVTADDLPAILSEDTINRGGDDVVKESYFFREALPSTEGISLSATGTSTDWVEGGTVGLDWNSFDEYLEDEEFEDEVLREYKIYYGKSSGAPYSRSTTTEDTYFELTGLSNGQTYYFSVTAIYESGAESDYSSEVSATPRDIVGPEPPDINNVAVGDEQVDLAWSWDDDSNGQASEFTIHYRASDSCGPDLNFGNSISVQYGSEGTTTIPDLNNGVEYCMAMTARDESGNSGATSTIAGTVIPFAVPEDFGVRNVGTSSAEFTWQYSDGAGGGVDHLDIVESDSPYPYSGGNIYSISGNPESYEVNGLSPNTGYYFNIRSYNENDRSSEYIEEIFITTQPLP